MKAFEAYDRWIFEEFRPCAKGLPFFRVLLALYFLLLYLPRYSLLGGLPRAFFKAPLSLATLIPVLPPVWFFYGLDFAAILCAVCLLFGYRTRLVTYGLLLLIIVGNTYRFSVGGKIDHDFLVVAALFCLGFSGWGNWLSHDETLLPRAERKSTVAWPITLLVFIIAYCMLTAALPKALSGWVSPHHFASRGHMISNYVQMDRPSWLADLVLQVHSPLFWKMADWSTLLVESGFILCIFSLSATRFVMASAVMFHSFVFYAMSIFFSFNLIVYASLLDLRRFLFNSHIRHTVISFRRVTHRVRFYHILVWALLIFGIDSLIEYKEVNLSFLPNNALMLTSLVIAVISLIGLTARGVDRFIFGHRFPLRANHLLVILYDGECGLCDKWVQFVLKHDRRRIFHFAALQSLRGKELLRDTGSPQSDLSSMVLVIDNKAYTRSTGPLMILRQLGGSWSLLGIFGIVPAPIRDLVYSFVAANRYSWFGKSNDSCRLLYPYERERFLS